MVKDNIVSILEVSKESNYSGLEQKAGFRNDDARKKMKLVDNSCSIVWE